LDKELGQHLRLKSTSFKINMLSICQSSRETEMMSTEKAVERKTQADFACLRYKLEAEVALFENHRLATLEWEHHTAHARAERLLHRDNLVECATNEYANLRFPMVKVADKDEATSTQCFNLCPSIAPLWCCTQPPHPPR